MKHTLVDATGEIVRVLDMPDTDEYRALNTPEGCTLLEGQPPVGFAYYVPATSEWVQRPDAPSEWHQWDARHKAWADPRTVQQRDEQQAAAIRAERNALLTRTDWVVTRALERHQDTPPDWLAYREALRAVPEQPGFPNDITWPTPP